MTTQQKALVQNSFVKVMPIADQASEIFYKRLFEIAPDLRPMFPADMTMQKMKLMQMLGSAVAGLDNMEALVPMVKEMGARHAGYGVKDEQYETVAAALLWTLEQGLGNDWNDELKEAWVEVYGVLAETMKEGARERGTLT
jgi:hemoglobin-like flavoprotein